MERNGAAEPRRAARWCTQLTALVLPTIGGCTDPTANLQLSHPSVASATQPTAALSVNASKIRPMYHRLLATDLPTVVRVATARNLDIKAAQQRVEALRGIYESSVEAIFPSLTPNITAVGIEGPLSSAGAIKLASLSTVVPAAAVQWIINPGLVAYDMIASQRRLEASAQQDEAVTQETIRVAADQYYDLVLTQAQVAVARQSMQDAEELLRLERLRLKTGTGLPADELRAEAALAGRQQDLISALNGFYNASLALSVTLHLDPTVMLVPRAGKMKQARLVREDLPIEKMLVTAVRYRPDLAAVRTLLAAAKADEGATVWGGLGPQTQDAAMAAPAPAAKVATDTLYRQRNYVVTGGFNWSLATFGRIKAATANVAIAGISLDRQLDRAQASVVAADQASITAAHLVPIAQQQVTSAEEALRLTQQNLKAGTGLTVDVLQAQATADRARARYATAIVRYNQSQIDLLAALGVIDEANVTARVESSPSLKPPEIR